jgi:hypothetical protein
MKAKELAWLCGVQHYAMLTLPRSVGEGWISLETALEEVTRRSTAASQAEENRLRREQLAQLNRMEREEKEAARAAESSSAWAGSHSEDID